MKILIKDPLPPKIEREALSMICDSVRAPLLISILEGILFQPCRAICCVASYFENYGGLSIRSFDSADPAEIEGRSIKGSLHAAMKLYDGRNHLDCLRLPGFYEASADAGGNVGQ